MNILKDPALLDLAKKMSSLKHENKEVFLGKLRKCADLFKVEGGGDIFTLSPNTIKYQLELISSLYHQLSGKKYRSYLCAEFVENPQFLEEKNLQDIIQRGVYAYCNASDENRSSFENEVKREMMAICIAKKGKQK